MNTKRFRDDEYFLGVASSQEGNKKQAKLHFQNFLNSYVFLYKEKYSGNLEDYCKQRIVCYFLNNACKENKDDIRKLLLHLIKIQQYVNSILKELYIDTKKMHDVEISSAHYTSVEVADKIINKGTFHLAVSNYMNDPTEGKVLLNALQIPFDNNDNLVAFLTSFTLNENSLNQFRLYGKKDNIDGSGVSLVVSKNFFSSALDSEKATEGGEENKELPMKLPLFRCIYMDIETEYVSVSQQSKFFCYLNDRRRYLSQDPQALWEKYIGEINKITSSVEDKLSKIKFIAREIKKIAEPEGYISYPDQIYKALGAILMPITYLIKHAAFEEEAECRVLYITSILDHVIEWEGERAYVAYKTILSDQCGQLQNYLEKIYLGPKADPRAELNLKKSWIDAISNGKKYNRSIKIPKIIKSDMPLA